MIVKITIVALVAFIARSTGEILWGDHVTISWNRDPSIQFYEVPTSLVAAKSSGWTKVSGINLSGRMAALCYRDDPTIILLFRDEKIIGVQYAILESDVNDSGQPLQWDEQDSIVRRTLNGKQYYTARVYFFHNKTTNTRKIWFHEKNGLREIPTDTSKLLSTTPYLEKKCIPTMGTHYYEWNSTSSCTKLQTWGITAVYETVVGVILQGFGNLTVLGPRTWKENIPAAGILGAIPDAPACAVDAANRYGIASIHTWFISKPQDISCP